MTLVSPRDSGPSLTADSWKNWDMAFLRSARTDLPHDADEDWFPVCAVFDCDGVLMDTERGWGEVVRTVAWDLGVASPEHLADRLTALTAAEIADVLAAESAGPKESAELTRERGREILLRLTAMDEARLRRGIDPIPGAAETVRALAAVMPVAVASNSASEILDAKLEAAGLVPHLSTWVSCSDVPEGKPAPDMYLEAVRRLGGDPARTLTFEDSVPGARAAVAAGTCAVVLAEDAPAAARAAEQQGPDAATVPPGRYYLSDFRDPDFLARLGRWTDRARSAG